MKKLIPLILAFVVVSFYSCQIEPMGSENLDSQLSKSKITSGASVINECIVTDVDRCPFSSVQPIMNLWWPEEGPDQDVNPKFFFQSTSEHQLTFTEYSNGTANIKGSTSMVEGNCVVNVDVWLKDKLTYDQFLSIGGNHKPEGCAGSVAGIEELLQYYTIDRENSKLYADGSDCLGEGKFGLEQRPDPNDLDTPNFGAHVGVGGANWDSDEDAVGLSTWGWILDYKTGERLWIMDFNFKLECEPQNDCGECDGKVTRLDLKYNGANAAKIVVETKKEGTVFDEMVDPGSTFTFFGNDKKGTLGTEITIYVDGDKNTEIHTSCSKPIGPGLVFGDFEVMGGASRNGGELCPADDEDDDCSKYREKCEEGNSKYCEKYEECVNGDNDDDDDGDNDDDDDGNNDDDDDDDGDDKCSKYLEKCEDGNSKYCEKYEECVNGDNDDDDDGNNADCGECDGKVTALELRYSGSSDADIRVVTKKEGEVFNQTVAAGGKFSFIGNDDKGTLGTEIIIYVNGEEHIDIHTSCSKPIGVGSVFGDFKVVSGSSRNGGEFCNDIPG